MSNLISWLRNGAKFIASEFLGQIVAVIILITAYVTWVQLSTGYAAVSVIVIGIAIWILVVKMFRKSEKNI